MDYIDVVAIVVYCNFLVCIIKVIYNHHKKKPFPFMLMKDAPDYICFPTIATKNSIGFDIGFVANTKTINPGESCVFRTYIKLNLMPNHYLELTKRSSFNGLIFGIIDQDYKGEILIKVVNVSKNPIMFTSEYVKVCQGIIKENLNHNYQTINRNIERGCGGFGSTNKTQ